MTRFTGHSVALRKIDNFQETQKASKEQQDAARFVTKDGKPSPKLYSLAEPREGLCSSGRAEAGAAGNRIIR